MEKKRTMLGLEMTRKALAKGGQDGGISRVLAGDYMINGFQWFTDDGSNNRFSSNNRVTPSA